MASSRIKEELLIVFVYDTGRLLKEEDDPVNALVYFYPSWVSDQQKLILCGQIIGTAHCVSSIFSAPRIISLRCGKFVFKHYENYILCVGTDRQAEDWCLQERADLLYNLVSLYHKNLDSIKANLPRDQNGEERETDGADMNEKLTNIFQVYLSLLLHSSIFKHLPILKLPKSGSTSFSEAMQLLQSFQGKAGVLGGTIMSRNKILASQLSSRLTKLLAVSDPYRLQIPADNVKTSYRLPVGVQLLKVHITHSEMTALQSETSFSREAVNHLKLRKQNGEPNYEANVRNSEFSRDFGGPGREFVGPGMSRHTSTIFTLHEQHEVSSPEETKSESMSNIPVSESTYTDVLPDVIKDSFLTRSLANVNITDYLAPDASSVNRHCSDDDLPCHTKHVPVRYYSFGLPKLAVDFEDTGIATTQGEEFVSQGDELNYYNTLSDSQFPYFRNNGLPASRNLYNTRLSDLLDQTKQFLLRADKEATKLEQKGKGTMNGKDMKEEEVELEEVEAECDKDEGIRKLERPQSIGGNLLDSGISGCNRRKQELHLIVGTDETDKAIPRHRPTTLEEPTDSGLEDNYVEPMTPLRAQLSQSSSDIHKQWASCVSLNAGVPKFSGGQKEGSVEVALYVCGFQDTALMLLLDLESVKTPELILYLWETSINYLNKLDSLLTSSLEPLSSDDTGEYSMLHLHPHWGSIAKSGAWSSAQLLLVSSLFNRLRAVQHLSEIIVKYDYQVLYCYQFANHQIFYHQNSESTTGLPPPSDLMGSIALKARRRLERDSQLIIL